MKLKPWYDVVKPREDLREGKSQDASEFAVHLDRVRDGSARDDYGKPEQFFAKTFLATNLLDLAAQTVRRWSGETSHTSPVFNLATNFGGGKTHALTLLYHLAENGPASHGWLGVSQIREKAAVAEIPKAKVAVFVGTEFDSLAGRGGDGEPRRTTPWGEIAFQLGGAAAFELVREHDEKKIAPGGDVIRKLLPENEPCLILIDELLNYVSRFRSLGLNTQLYNFLLGLSGALNPKSVLVVSLPGSELEMTADDVADYERFTKMLDRVGKAITVTAGPETSEIIRRRLFEWDTRALNPEGKVLLPKDAEDTCHEYGRWINERADQNLSNSIPPDHARSHFEASYPFHPTALSVFERKWQTVPRFQRTRGVLRMLALWIQDAYQQAYRKAHPDPLLSLGTAPFHDSFFRAAVFEQLGSQAFEAAVMFDIAGSKEAHAIALDEQASDSIKKERLHQRVASTVFFESNGGMTKSEATIAEIRLAVGHPGLDLGNIETALDALTERCFYLVVERNNYKFSLKENLNKRFINKRDSISPAAIEDTVNREIQKQFTTKNGVERIFFPERSVQISDRPVITFVVCDLAHTMEDSKSTLQTIESMTRECGTSGRTFKSALLWMVADSAHAMREGAHKFLAWQAIEDEAEDLKLEDAQRKQLAQNVQRAERDLKESVWRSYNRIVLLGKDNSLRQIDLGRVSVSQATSIISMVLGRLRQDDEVQEFVSPSFLVRKWSPAFKEWSTKSVRDAFFASPEFPRLLDTSSVKETIAKGVSGGLIAYVGKTSSGYDPFVYNKGISASEVEISDDVFIIKKETAEEFLKNKQNSQTTGEPTTEPVTDGTTPPPTEPTQPSDRLFETSTLGAGDKVNRITWSGEVPPQKWSTFYNRVLAKFAVGQGLKLRVNVEIAPDEGVSKQKIDETKTSLRELGLDDDLNTE